MRDNGNMSEFTSAIIVTCMNASAVHVGSADTAAEREIDNRVGIVAFPAFSQTGRICIVEKQIRFMDVITEKTVDIQ